MQSIRLGFALTGSFCTFSKAFDAICSLTHEGFDVLPIMSFNSYNISTRFGSALDNRNKIRELCGHDIISTIEDAEPIGPKGLTDILLVSPCTGNTLAKLAFSITDTPVTMAVKSHLRGKKPVVVAVSTNDALAGTAKNLGSLLNMKHYFFVPLRQDDPQKKPTSLVADFSRVPQTLRAANEGVQIEPILLNFS